MSFIEGLIHRARVLVRGERYAREQDDELRFHLDLDAMHAEHDGREHSEAGHVARRRLGNLTFLREQLRRAAGFEPIDRLRQDIGYALRGIRRSPGLAGAIVLTLAFGIGANAAVFVAADRMFLRAPPGISDPSSLRRLYLRTNWSSGAVAFSDPEFTYPAFEALASGMSSRASFAANTHPDSVPLGAGDATAMVRASYVTGGYLPMLGVNAAVGRILAPGDDRMGAGSPVAVISEALWRRRFGGDPDIVGRSVDLAWQRYTIVGVAAGGFAGTDLDGADVWMPLAMLGAEPMSETVPWYGSWRSSTTVQVLARVRAGATDSWLSMAGTAIYRRGELQAATRRPDTSAVLEAGPLLQLRGPAVDPTTASAIETRLVGVAAIVLLIACANVASLLLVRMLGRRREIAVRLALGVSRLRLLAQFLAESIVLSLVAGLAALTIGAWGGGALRSMLLPGIHWAGPPFDMRVALFTIAVSVATGALVGIVPAHGATRLDVIDALRGGARGGARSYARLRHSLIVAQVALSVVLLVGAGLFVRSLSRVRGIDLGYDTDRIVLGNVSFLNEEGHYIDRFGSSHDAELVAGLPEAAARIRRLPGVEETALATNGPMAGWAGIGLWRRDGTTPPRLANRDPALLGVSPSFFRATGAALLRGRLFTDDDRAGAPPVVVVNETAARTYWPSEEALGQCLVLLRRTYPCATVVGVTKDSHVADVIEVPTVELFTPLAQGAVPVVSTPRTLVVRTAPDRARVLAVQVLRELRRAFPAAAPVAAPLALRLERQVRPWRLGVELFSALGLLALIIAGVGVYSMIAYTFSQRSHEMGIRAALGAQRIDMVRLVLGEGLAIVAVGVLAGIVLALGASRLVGALLFGVSAHDPLTLCVGALVLFAVGLVASLLPALRASHVDPVVTLRAE